MTRRNFVSFQDQAAFTAAELDSQHTAELPARDLMIGISILGLPLVSLDGLAVNVNTAGPNWLFGSVGKVG
jgi:hypothetical protein